jgi:protein involved in polysaccharide export with SLBB domain
MNRDVSARGGWLLAAVLLLPAGCTSGPGGSLLFFPSGHRLIEPARAMRAAASEPADLPRELAKQVGPPYTLEPGDVLLVQPARLESPVRLPGDQPVLPDGTIQLGQYGRLLAAGKTVEQVEAEANALIGRQVRDAGPVVARLVTRDSKVYYVVGEVNAPAAIQWKGRETVLDAIFAAGGLTSNASRRNIILSRPTPPGGCRVVLPVCWNEIVQLGDTTTNYQVKAGDRIYVPTKTLFEDLCHKKPECPPCGRPQVPCPVATGGPPGEAGVPGVAHALPVAPPPAPARESRPAAPAGQLLPPPRGESPGFTAGRSAPG